jgi:Spy/CpxP family protein refolding chaperone
MKRSHPSTLAFVLAALWFSIASTALRAQQPGPDPIAEQLFPPELAMKFSREIDLGDAQRTAIKEAVKKAQGSFLDAQFDMASETGTMVRLLQANPVDQKAVLAQLDRVLALEATVKRAQITLLIEIKNQLTPAQQAKLRELRRSAP